MRANPSSRPGRGFVQRLVYSKEEEKEEVVVDGVRVPPFLVIGRGFSSANNLWATTQPTLIRNGLKVFFFSRIPAEFLIACISSKQRNSFPP
jgi:hypothetical protein